VLRKEKDILKNINVKIINVKIIIILQYYNNMPDIINIPPSSPVRSRPITRLRTSTLAASVRSRQQHNLRTRRHALKDELKRIEATLKSRIREHETLTQQLRVAENHMRDDAMRLRYLPRLLTNTSQRSQIEELTQTDAGQRATEVERMLVDYQANRPYDIETIERLRTELFALDDTMYANTQALIAPIQEEIDLAQTNYDEGYRSYRNLDGRLINHSLLTRDLTQARDDANRQSNDINIELALGRGHRIRRQRRPTYKRGKKGKRTRKRRL
jgi:chromosome segregation ATPase